MTPYLDTLLPGRAPHPSPLHWCSSALTQALAECEQQLLAWLAGESEAVPAAALCQQRLRQIDGAFRLLGAYDLSQVLAALTHALGVASARSDPSDGVLPASLELVRALSAHLQAVTRGQAQGALPLYPYYAALQKRLKFKPSPVDLFDPGQSLDDVVASYSAVVPLATPGSASGPRSQVFERALIDFMRQPLAAREALTQMVGVLEPLALQHSNSRNLWSLALGVLRARALGALAPDVDLRAVLTRLSAALRGQQNPAAVLQTARECLFVLAHAHPIPDELRTLWQAFGITSLRTADYLQHNYPLLDKRVVQSARALLREVQGHWEQAVQSQSNHRAEIYGECLRLSAALRELNERALADLVEACGQVVSEHARKNQPLGASRQFAISCALIVIESALEQSDIRPSDFESQVRQLLQIVQDGDDQLSSFDRSQAGTHESSDWLRNLAQRMHGRKTLSACVRECQVNLSHIESVIDGALRHPDHAERLASVAPLLKQLTGALALLNQSDAVATLQSAQGVIEHAHRRGMSEHDIEIEGLVKNFAALSFLIAGLDPEQPRLFSTFEFDPITASLVPHWRERAPVMPPAVPPTASDTDFPVLTQAIEIPAPVLPVLVHEQILPTEDLLADVPRLSELAPLPAEASSPTTQSEPQAHIDDFDADLIAVFLNESQELLLTAQATLALLRADPRNQIYLSSLRRFFHTLKGGARMVGLNHFADGAAALENVYQAWSSQEPGSRELPVASAFIELSERALGDIQAWVLKLQGEVRSHINPDSLVSAAQVWLEKSQAEPAADTSDLVIPEQAADAPIPDHEQTPLEQALEPRDEAKPLQPNTDFVSLLGGLTEVDLELGPSNAVEIARNPDGPSYDTVTIGPLQIDRGVLDVFLAESDGLLRRLLSETHLGIARGADSPSAVSTEFQRYLHALTSSARAIGLEAVVQRCEQLDRTANDVAAWHQHTELQREQIMHGLQSVQADLHQFAAGVYPPMPTESAHQPSAQPAPPAQASEPSVQPNKKVDDEISADFQPTITSPVPTPPPVGEMTDAMSPDTDQPDPDLLPIFIDEGDELMPAIGGHLRRWRQELQQSEHAQALMRLLHTAKGSARMAGCWALGAMLHEMEAAVENLVAEGSYTTDQIDTLLRRYDQVILHFDQIAGRGVGEIVQPTQIPESVTGPQDHAPSRTATSSPPTPASQSSTTTVVRVRADVLDRMVSQSGEISIARTRLEDQTEAIRGALSELSENIARLRNQLREIEIQSESAIHNRQHDQDLNELDPLEFDRYTRSQELTRMLAESVEDVATVQQNLSLAASEATKDLARQALATRDLHRELMRVRMVQFGPFADRFFRVVRQVAQQLGKQASLRLIGAEVELDRGVLERMTGPIEHLLRNAVVHGIELPSERSTAKKPVQGRVTLEVRQDGNEIVLVLSDDGRGLDTEKIRRKAIERGLIGPNDSLSAHIIDELIFAPGFSTADAVTALAGRGVGMDVVRSEVAALGGRVEVGTELGRGTSFTIHLPLSLAVTQVVLVTVANATYAIPSLLIEQILQVKAAELESAYTAHKIETSAGQVPFAYLGGLLEDYTAKPPVDRSSTVLIIAIGGERIAIHVDSLIPNKEVVVKSVGPQLARIAGITGATVLGNGQIVLIINPVQLSSRQKTRLNTPTSNAATNWPETPSSSRSETILVVDDSLTVRKVTQRLLMRNGFNVLLARDGVDALRLLEDEKPVVMLVDIEMPRMDGFDFVRHIRASPSTASTPVIMITSRTADKHRGIATAIGVDRYMGKPFHEDELIAAIRHFIRYGRNIAA